MLKHPLHYYRHFIMIAAVLLSATSSAQPSRIELKSHTSSLLGQTKQFNVLLPEGYDSEMDHYPVLYLFRGAVDEWADPSEDASRRGNIKTVYDSLYAIASVGRMILIMPGLGAPASANEYTYVINELLPYVDSCFRTIPDRWHRAMDGFSLGGLITTNLLAGAPHSFASAGSYDGTLSLFDNSKFSNGSASLFYALKQTQLLYHTGAIGGNNHNNNLTTFSILNANGIFNTFEAYRFDPNAQHNWFYADKHMGITLPLHWNKMQSASNSLSLTLKTTFTGPSVSGNVNIDWTRKILPQSLTTHILFSSDNGRKWTKAFTTTTNDSTWNWNTVPLSDGTRYRLKVITAGDTLFGSAVSPMFTVNNPGNGAPDVEFTGISGGDTVSGQYTIHWLAADAEGDPLNISVDASFNGGATWTTIAFPMANTGNWTFNSLSHPNSSTFRLRLSCSDGAATSQTVSPPLKLLNTRFVLSNAIFEHLSGTADPVLTALTSSPDSLTSANFLLTFKETAGKKSYTVTNSKGVPVVTDATELDGTTEGPLFSGFRLLIKDFVVPTPDPLRSRWKIGTSDLLAEVKLTNIFDGVTTTVAKPFASDYEIKIFNTIVDTSFAVFGAPALPVNFTVWNTTLNRKTKFLFVEVDGSGTLTRNDELYLFEHDSANPQILTWYVLFYGQETSKDPVPGDIFTVKIAKPITQNDSYQFIYYPPLSVQQNGRFPATPELGQNFPNPFNPNTTIFVSLPYRQAVTLTVYDLLGRNIQSLYEGILDAGPHRFEWNAGRYASGLYFYRLQAGTFRETKKMLLTK